MESSRRRRRRAKKPKAPKPKTTVDSSPIGGATTSTVHDVPDDVLEVILLRLDSFVSLVRAACACRRWCRVLADALPAPLILGHYYHANHPELVFVPSSTPSIGDHSRRQSAMSLDFIPKLYGSWKIADSRDTLLLLSKKDLTTTASSSDNPGLVVCRPLTRRYKAISVPDRITGHGCLGLFLAGGATGSGRLIGLSNFRVIAMLVSGRGAGMPVACVYEGRCGWRDVSCTWTAGDISIPYTRDSFFFAGRAGGRLYWAINGTGTALALDEATMGVSLLVLPAAMHSWYQYAWSCCFRIIGGGEDAGGAGSLRAVYLMGNDLRVYASLRAGDEWVLQNLLQLPVLENVHGRPWNAIVAAHETYVLVRPRNNRLFSVDLKTMAVECVPQGIMDCGGAAYPYELPWPPTLDVEAEAAADNNPSDPKNPSDLGACSKPECFL